MGILLTLFYVVAALLTPAALFGSLAQFHLQVVIAMLTLIASLFSLEDSDLLRMPQTYAVMALVVVVTISVLLTGWLGGTMTALLDFIPTAIVFYFIVLNFRTRWHFQLLAGVLFLVSVYVIYQGWAAQNSLDESNPFVLIMKNADEESFYRIRGLGFLNDPNDFSQFLVGLIPCMFFFWRKGKVLLNFALVYVPVAVLLYGMFLTHSRGGMVALLVMAIVMFRRKLGTVWSVVAGGVLFLGISALGWSGGRDVSAEAGSDRTDAWSVGLELIKHHPIFGVGYGRFTDYYVITAHNTVVVCAAELGLVGFFFWMLLILTSVRDAQVAATDPALDEKSSTEDEEASAGSPFSFQTALRGASFAPAAAAAALPLEAYDRAGGAATALPMQARASGDSVRAAVYDPFQPEEDQGLPEAEIRRLGRVAMLCLTGFLTAGWFLSRAYTMVLFLYMGLAVAAYRMAYQAGYAPPPLAVGKACKRAAIGSVALIIVVYIILRINNLIIR